MTNVYKKEYVSIKDVEFGKHVKVVEPVNLYGCSIDANSFVGPFVEIQKDVKIGKNTKIQSHSFFLCKTLHKVYQLILYQEYYYIQDVVFYIQLF